MSYVVLARKLRPTRFDDLTGQETIARILKNAIAADRVAHAFLFSGSRGVGKTSCARILAKALNCLSPQGSDPCNQCNNCVDIHNNASPDVYEIDAASNRRIDEIRELRENVKYAPAHCRYKIYIIDEAHMLTMESFNALLKTLEEPPPHVKFILATTDPHKIPQTVLSRCQRYDFIRIPLKKMADYLAQVCEQEGIQLSRHALEMISRQSIGGMRDALTALDQVIGYAGGTASDEEVARLLGMIDNESRMKLLETLLRKQSTEAMEGFYGLQEHGNHLQDVLTDLLVAVKNISLIQSLGLPPTLFQDLTDSEKQRYQELGKLVKPDELQQIFHILLELEETMRQSSHAQICFEMAILKITSVQSLVGIRELLEQVQTLTASGSIPQKSAANNTPTPSHSQPSRPAETFVPPPREVPPLPEPPRESSVRTTETAASAASIKAFLQQGKTSGPPPPQTAPVRYSSGNTGSPANSIEVDKKKSELKSDLTKSETVSARISTPAESFSDVVAEPEAEPEMPPEEWIKLVNALQQTSHSLGAFLKSTVLVTMSEMEVVYGFKEKYAAQIPMFSKEHQFQVARLIQNFLKRDVKVHLTEKPLKSSVLTVKEAQDYHYQKNILKMNQEAESSEQVQNILKAFPGSTIISTKHTGS
ncbi:MAG: DNA polymerase III subunit gamma/tau [SAR324 cluster bacterium]|nr:DNA polymerase III subunit gamma/tau [SAR324 cluster bacterium]